MSVLLCLCFYAAIPNLPRNTYPLVSNTFTDHRPAKPPVIDGEIQARDLFHPVVTSSPYPSFSSASSASSAASAPTTAASAPAPSAPSATPRVELSPSTSESYVTARERVRLVASEMEGGGEGGRPGDDIVVIPTGTSSAVVSRFRNGELFLILLTFPSLSSCPPTSLSPTSVLYLMLISLVPFAFSLVLYSLRPTHPTPQTGRIRHFRRGRGDVGPDR